MRLTAALVRLKKTADFASQLQGYWDKLKASRQPFYDALADGSQVVRDLADAIELLARWFDDVAKTGPVRVRTCRAIHAHMAAIAYTVSTLLEAVDYERTQATDDADADALDDCQDAVESMVLCYQQLERLIRRKVPCPM